MLIMSDISQRNFDLTRSLPNMQQQEQQQDIETHKKEGNELTDPNPTFPSPKVNDERADEVPPSSVIKEVTKTTSVPSPLKNIELPTDVMKTDPASSSFEKKRFVDDGNENVPCSLSPSKWGTCC
ncbi:hypothetical protein P9112_000115 [Eukaryota sp. TZLM1-RC]